MTFFSKQFNIYEKDVDIMGQLILRIIALIFILIGIIMIYEARNITKKFFGFGDQNEGSLGLKLIGFLISILGAFALLFI